MANLRCASRHLAAVALVTLSGLIFEIGLTRIFSLLHWYHLAFVAVSSALFGWGLGGFTLHVLRKHIVAGPRMAAASFILYAAAIPASLFLIVRMPGNIAYFPWCILAASIPFIFAGGGLAAIFTSFKEDSGKLYCADLFGAAAGILCSILLLSYLGGERAILAAVLPALAAAALINSRIAAPAAILSVLVFLALSSERAVRQFGIVSSESKALFKDLSDHPGARVDQTAWNSFSRIDTVTGIPGSPARLYIDFDAWTDLQPWDGREETLASFGEWARARPFELTPNKNVLIIGPGGGVDVLSALSYPGTRVTAVEMNPLILKLAGHYVPQIGDFYNHPRVKTVLAEGRSFIEAETGKYDVICLGYVDTWAAAAGGGLALTENYLYTVDAFRAYLDRLTPRGMLLVVRDEDDLPRLISNAVALVGREEAAKRVAAIKQFPSLRHVTAFMLRKEPFSPEDTDRLMQWRQTEPLIVPGKILVPRYAELLSGDKPAAQVEAEWPTLIHAVYDRSPYFFATDKPYGVTPRAQRGFEHIFLVFLACALLFVIVGGRPSDYSPAYYASVIYFSGLGAGFIAVELTLLQHLILLVGHPLYTLAVLLFSLLLAGAAGAYFSGRIGGRAACWAVFAAACTYAVILPAIVPPLLAYSPPVRIALAALLIAPIGFLMGMPFPAGLRATDKDNLPGPAFFWGLNGLFTVIGSLGVVALAVVFGFSAALAAGALCYLASALTAPYFIRT